MLVVLFVTVGLVAMLVVLAIEFRRTPEGFEDEAGFHFGGDAASAQNRPKPVRLVDAGGLRKRERRQAVVPGKL
jgi:hypothetical protein